MLDGAAAGKAGDTVIMKYRIIITGDFAEEDGYSEELLRSAVKDAAEDNGMLNTKVTLEDEYCIRKNDAKGR